MKLVYQQKPEMNPLVILRKAGYSHFIDPNTNHESFVLRTGPDFYPRFHVYVETDAQTFTIDLHLDQKKPQYKGARAHNGEYDGPIVEREIARLAQWVQSLYNVFPIHGGTLEQQIAPPTSLQHVELTEQQEPTAPPAKKPGLFGGIF